MPEDTNPFTTESPNARNPLAGLLQVLGAGLMGFGGQGAQALELLSKHAERQENRQFTAQAVQWASAGRRLEDEGNLAGARDLYSQAAAASSKRNPTVSKQFEDRHKSLSERIEQTTAVKGQLQGLGVMSPGTQPGMGSTLTLPPGRPALGAALEGAFTDPGGPGGKALGPIIQQLAVQQEAARLRRPFQEPQGTLSERFARASQDYKDAQAAPDAGTPMGQFRLEATRRAYLVADQALNTEKDLARLRGEGGVAARLTDQVGARSSDFSHPDTGQPPPAELSLADVHSNYVSVKGEGLKAIVSRARPLGNVLGRIREIITTSPDLYPPSTGSTVQDLANVGMAQARFFVAQKVDPRAAFLKDAIAPYGPALNRFSGDTANTAIQERAANLQALAASPRTRESALAILDELESNIRRELGDRGFNVERLLGPRGGTPAASPSPERPGFTLPGGATIRRR